MSDINWKRHGPSMTSKPYRHSWPDMSEDLPVDVLPCSNDEYFPPEPSREQLAIMELANRETERMRTRFGMSRRNFVGPPAASAIGFWAIDAVRMGLGQLRLGAQHGRPTPATSSGTAAAGRTRSTT